jgi:predicted phosphodiesterase
MSDTRDQGTERAGLGPIGLLADSHGKNDLLLDTIDMLEEMGSLLIIHLGDICDSLIPSALDEAVMILKGHGVKAVKGNNEHAILTENEGPYANGLSQDALSYLTELPYTITLGGYCFAHSAPFEWPAATRWPVTDNHPLMDLEKVIPCRILFRGHSHTPSIIEVDGTRTTTYPVGAGMIKRLSRDKRYIITVGAVEESSAALFLPDEYEIQFLRTDRKR